MIVPLSVYLFYAKNNSQSTLNTHLTKTSTFTPISFQTYSVRRVEVGEKRNVYVTVAFAGVALMVAMLIGVVVVRRRSSRFPQHQVRKCSPDSWGGLLTPLSPPSVHTLPVLHTNTITSREAFMFKIKFHCSILASPPAKSPLGWRIFHTFNFYLILTFYFSSRRQLVSVQTAKIGNTKEVGSGLTQPTVNFCNVLPSRDHHQL